MPLTKPAPRKMLHIRNISLHGYEREDGLFDIEAHMTDIRTYSMANVDRGGIRAGEPVHDMWLRVTIGLDMTIQASEAVMDGTPHFVCTGVAPNYQRLVGLNIGKGFLKAAMQRLGGIEGCTHLRELLQQVGTTAYQTLAGSQQAGPKPDKGIPAKLVNSCYAFNENGALVKSFREKAEAE